MQANIYIIRFEQDWRLIPSLDIKTDLQWWFAQSERSRLAAKLIWLTCPIPLGWAIQLRNDFKALYDMEFWDEQRWRHYITGALNRCIRLEPPLEQVGWLHRVNHGVVIIRPSVEASWLRSEYEPSLWLRIQNLSKQMEILLQGRGLLAEEVESLLQEEGLSLPGGWLAAAQLGYLKGRLSIESGIIQESFTKARRCIWRRSKSVERSRCRRCGSDIQHQAACASCSSHACAYCEVCISMGRCRSCAIMLMGKSYSVDDHPSVGSPRKAELTTKWGLSAAQGTAALAALQFLKESAKSETGDDRFLIWAVTGAGKTEMIFPLLDFILQRESGKVLVAAPRRDVVLELAPRLMKAFPNSFVVTLYGGSPDRWKQGNITVATTHQLLRFKGTFDLIVIDEIDAFPYHNNPMLDYAARAACKPGGKYIYLSATPPARMQLQASSGQIRHAKVPARFHGYPLPVPTPLKLPSVEQCLSKNQLAPVLCRQLNASLQREAQIFVFVTRIRHIDPLVKLLRSHFRGKYSIQGVSSVDPGRSEKVAMFRQRLIRILVTTTILERGVTVPKSDVFILDADSQLFDEAALIQMAGRAGRSNDDPTGKVIIGAPHWTRSQRRAVAQIRLMNRIARRDGYLNASL
ncbi:DEAD/DEAH box helicase [Paenibacillus sp. JSM ZJ436]|uniref:DEAD/DEAH box helicase n=1 Tax=Paenibacillus sp. JSM ZJ436 TaxID=3376190 RepID=UPI00378FFB65